MAIGKKMWVGPRLLGVPSASQVVPGGYRDRKPCAFLQVVFLHVATLTAMGFLLGWDEGKHQDPVRNRIKLRSQQTASTSIPGLPYESFKARTSLGPWMRLSVFSFSLAGLWALGLCGMRREEQLAEPWGCTSRTGRAFPSTGSITGWGCVWGKALGTFPNSELNS